MTAAVDWQLHHGDCADILPDLGVKADLILTSPPYDNLRTYGGHGFDFDRVADACVGVLADGGVIVWVVADAIVDGSEAGTSFRQALGFMERGLRLHQTLYFIKTTETARGTTRYAPTSEYMFVFSCGPPSVVNLLRDKPNAHAGSRHMGAAMGRKHNDEMGPNSDSYIVGEYGVRTNLWRYFVGAGAPGRLAGHPAQFPLLLAKDHILTWTNPGDVVLDPMAGSGTVLRAAVDLRRQAIGVEIHEGYLPIIRNRMAQQVLL